MTSGVQPQRDEDDLDVFYQERLGVDQSRREPLIEPFNLPIYEEFMFHTNHVVP